MLTTCMDQIAKWLGRLAMGAATGLLVFIGFVIVNGTLSTVTASNPHTDENRIAALQLFDQGNATFRFATFGDEVFWGGVLHLNEVVATLSPSAVLGLGLKVDSDALTSQQRQALEHSRFDLEDPAVTLQLIQQNAVVGVVGSFDSSGALSSMGITCALCHSTVDDSVAAGIGRRLDGWANRDLDVGTIISLAPNKQSLADLLGTNEATLNNVLAAWGPGKFDAELFLDGRGFRPDGTTPAVLIPPAFGLAGVNLSTYTGWGSATYWNAFEANLVMHGMGTFFDPRLNDASQFPIAAKAGFGNIRNQPDLITPKLAALHVYQLDLKAPPPPAGSFDAAAAQRGQTIFNEKGCAFCHVPPLFTDPGLNLHLPTEICIDSFESGRSPAGGYRTTPLKGLFTHIKGGFYHDGRFPDLDAVVDHYNTCFVLGLTAPEQADLVQYLKSL